MNWLTNLEMDFTERFTTMLIGIRITIAIDPSNRFIADNFGAFFSFMINDNFIRSMNLVVRENSILKNKPSRSPSFTVIHPFIQYTGDSISDEVVDLQINNHRRLFPLTTVAMAVTMNRSRRIGSNSDRWWWRRRHGEVSERRRRFHRRSLVGNSGDAAERMHDISVWIGGRWRGDGDWRRWLREASWALKAITVRK